MLLSTGTTRYRFPLIDPVFLTGPTTRDLPAPNSRCVAMYRRHEYNAAHKTLELANVSGTRGPS
ncbi:MAG: hypothetical protein QGI88_12385, partial [SAR202 cluster bacterium]|nr:hypothetical protein [SAR202 cluster bacterium]